MSLPEIALAPGMAERLASKLTHALQARDSFLSRKRSNSQSQGASQAVTLSTRRHDGRPKERPRRAAAEYYVTLAPLNSTFVKKHIHVPVHPETCKLGRPTGTKVKPSSSNGYFDSRVLSRNHACLFVDAQSGQVMIQDMGSSNGTFVNSDKIGLDPVPIRIGDTVNLGFNIQVETLHKQISAAVENISIVSTTPRGAAPGLTPDLVATFSPRELAHYDFVQSTLAAAPEDAMFADIMPAVEDLLARGTEETFPHSRIRPSSEMQRAVALLTLNVGRVQQQNLLLRALENFLAAYAARALELHAAQLAAQDERHQLQLREGAAERRQLQLQAQEHQHAAQRLQATVDALQRRVAQLEAEKTLEQTRRAPPEKTPPHADELHYETGAFDAADTKEDTYRPALSLRHQGVCIGIFVVVGCILQQMAK